MTILQQLPVLANEDHPGHSLWTGIHNNPLRVPLRLLHYSFPQSGLSMGFKRVSKREQVVHLVCQKSANQTKSSGRLGMESPSRSAPYASLPTCPYRTSFTNGTESRTILFPQKKQKTNEEFCGVFRYLYTDHSSFTDFLHPLVQYLSMLLLLPRIDLPRGFSCFGTPPERACTPQSSSGATRFPTMGYSSLLFHPSSMLWGFLEVL